MVHLSEKAKCTGCLACYNICPANAIDVVSDDQGFLFPKIDFAKCKNCHMCETVCSQLNTIEGRNIPETVYAAWRNDEIARSHSNSGGIAASIAEYAFSRGYTVVGAIIGDDLVVRHCICDTEEQLNKLRMSKYVQSSIFDIYKQVKNKLLNGEQVVFFGTPCQTDAVKRVVGEKFKTQLLTVDLICHGVPSPKYLEDHLLSLVKSLDDVKTYAFRDNNQYVFQVLLNNGKKIAVPQSQDSYLYAFMKNVLDRESCHTCRYSSTSRSSDITLGDFWGLNSVHTAGVKVEHHKGISAVLINTQQGYDFFEAVKSDLFVEERNLSEVVRYNPFLRPITNSNEDRFEFREKYNKKGFENAVLWLKRKYYFKDTVELLFKKIKYKFMKIKKKMNKHYIL